MFSVGPESIMEIPDDYRERLTRASIYFADQLWYDAHLWARATERGGKKLNVKWQISHPRRTQRDSRLHPLRIRTSCHLLPGSSTSLQGCSEHRCFLGLSDNV